jgi:hypothetical protein
MSWGQARAILGRLMIAAAVGMFVVSLWPSSVVRTLVVTKQTTDVTTDAPAPSGRPAPGADAPPATPAPSAPPAPAASAKAGETVAHSVVHTDSAIALPADDWRPSLVALAVLFLGIGMAVAVPTLLGDGTLHADGTPNVSVMRVVLYGTVLLFGFVTVRAGWGATSMADVHIDPWWVALLSIVSAAKVAQSYGEPSGGAGQSAGGGASRGSGGE